MIQDRYDKKRGCGWRKPGGLYLISSGEGRPCCKLPFPLTVCPCCSAGIKFSRGWTWVDVDKLFFPNGPELHPDAPQCHGCPLNDYGIIGRAGLLWVGEKFYPTTADFTKEMAEQGISRRIHSIPNDFKLGETWVLLAHIKAIYTKKIISQEPLDWTNDHAPGIFYVFRPTAIEYVVKGDETDEELERLEKRGITPVRIVKPEPKPYPIGE